MMSTLEVVVELKEAERILNRMRFEIKNADENNLELLKTSTLIGIANIRERLTEIEHILRELK